MELSLSDVRELLRPEITETPYELGESYLIRCVTLYYTGRLVRETEGELVLEDAAWIASTGRFHVALRDGTLDEVEPYASPVIVPKGTIVDATVWSHPLPREAK